jgi:protease I
MANERVLLPLPAVGYECTEASVPWQVLTSAGHEVVFATPDGKPAQVDRSTSTGEGLGWLGMLFKAAKPSFAAHAAMVESSAYQAPIRWDAIEVDQFDAVVIPGGHHQEMAPFLASKVLQERIAEFAEKEKIVASICHGVPLAARSKGTDGRSLLADRRVTTVPAKSENQVQKMCSKRMGHERFGKPNPLTAEEEIRQLMAGSGELVIVRMPLLKDGPGKEERGLCFVDGNIITARMPHDSWCFAKNVAEQLAARA